ncbi:hypothetical protein LSH36_713g01117 [Paralvinella palmiformis]|uniref:Uncharacterized protein n=1 Tax=Paralvinella palmiformis TaxID=53620 RepID=A0AAD9J3K8_9ANNE|nr:hypothetical protein LSH36_713g01117 [Paralvinella palmiformis]
MATRNRCINGRRWKTTPDKNRSRREEFSSSEPTSAHSRPAGIVWPALTTTGDGCNTTTVGAIPFQWQERSINTKNPDSGIGPTGRTPQHKAFDYLWARYGGDERVRGQPEGDFIPFRSFIVAYDAFISAAITRTTAFVLRSRLRRTHRGPIAVPVVQSELPDILPKTRTALHGRIRSVHGTRASAISHSGSPADPEHAIPQNVARTTPEAKASHRVSRVRTINTRARTGMHARSRFHTIPAAKANQEDPESKQTLVQVTTLGKDGTKNPDVMPRQVTEVTQARETTKGDATVTSYDHPKAKEPPKRRTRKKLPPSVTILRSRIVHTTKSRGRDVEVTPVEDEKTGRKLIPLRGLRGRRRGNRRTERVHADSEAKEAITNSTLPVIIDPEVRDKPAAETENAPVTVIPAGNPSRVKLARGRTHKRRLLRPLTWLLTTPSIAGQDTESETPIKGMRTHRVSVGHRRGQRQRGSTTSGNQTTQVHSNGNPERVKLVRRPETARRRLRLTTTHSADMISGTESVTAETVLGRRRHRIGGRKRIKVHTTTTPATTTVWPPSVAFPTQGPSMGGNPFEGILSKGDLFKMGRGLHPDWWQDPTVGECPGEHLVVHSSLYFHCARRDHNDLSDPYGKCIHGDSMCKQESSMSKCCYNGCGDICLKPEKLIHQFCYEAMGSIRYQPGEEFMHGEWWCKCDPKKKSYQEMCTRLKCTIGDLVRTLRRHDIEIARIVSMLYKYDHDLNENSEESEESSEEESEEESTEEESSEEESNEEESNEEESSEEESGEEESSEEESEEEKSKSEKEPKCKKGSKGCGKGKRKPKCKKGKGKCKKPHSGGGRPKGKGKRCKKGDPKCKKPPPGGGSPGKWKKCKKGDPKCKKPHPGGGGPGKWKKCKKGDPKCKKPHPGGGDPGKWKKCKKGDPKCKKPHPGGGSPGKGKKCKKGDHGCQKPHGRRPKWKRKCKKGAGKCGKPHRKCKNGKCKWHKKPKPPVTKWRPGGHGNGGWKKHKVTHVKKHNFSFKKPWKGRWKTKAWGKALETNVEKEVDQAEMA